MVSLYREFASSPRLARYVECYWVRHGCGSKSYSVLPDGCADILFTSRNREPVDLRLVGLMTKPLRVEATGPLSYFGVRFRPGMAAAFVPEVSSLNDRVERLEDVWGRLASSLLEQLAESSGVPAMVEVIEQHLRPLEPPDAVCRALWKLSTANVPLEQFAFDAGLSARHFRRACLLKAGVSPKYLERILRFRRAVERIHAVSRRAAQPSWAQLAAACGYYDQAHFIREFQEFAGCTPGRFLQSSTGGSAVESKDDDSTETGKSDRLY